MEVGQQTSINQEHPMTDQDESPINQEERVERLSVRILAGAREIVSRGDGRMLPWTSFATFSHP